MLRQRLLPEQARQPVGVLLVELYKRPEPPLVLLSGGRREEGSALVGWGGVGWGSGRRGGRQLAVKRPRVGGSAHLCVAVVQPKVGNQDVCLRRQVVLQQRRQGTPVKVLALRSGEGSSMLAHSAARASMRYSGRQCLHSPQYTRQARCL